LTFLLVLSHSVKLISSNDSLYLPTRLFVTLPFETVVFLKKELTYIIMFRSYYSVFKVRL
jgi:hypothetical protein